MATIADREYAIEARRRGVPYATIARKCGVSRTTIRRWTSPEFQRRSDEHRAAWLARPENRAKQREYEARKAKGRCESCRGRMSTRKDGVCKSCRKEAQTFRRLDIQRYWNEEQLTSPEIAERMGVARTIVESELTRMRRDGWDLAYRGGYSGAYLRRQGS